MPPDVTRFVYPYEVRSQLDGWITLQERVPCRRLELSPRDAACFCTFGEQSIHLHSEKIPRRSGLGFGFKVKYISIILFKPGQAVNSSPNSSPNEDQTTVIWVRVGVHTGLTFICRLFCTVYEEYVLV